MQVELQQELQSLREEMSTLYASNDINEIVKASHKEKRIREVEEELIQANPVEDYYLKNMDILNDY